MALSFDAGANADGVASILDTLKRDHVRATFFLTGDFVGLFKSEARAIVAGGMRVGDHSISHPYFTKLSDTEIRQQVLGARDEIKSVTGADPWPWFRFPYFDRNDHAIAVVNSVGFVPIGWTVDTLGWMGTSGGITVRTVVNRVLANRRPGEIVLMHGGSDAHDNSTLDADALPTVISKLRADGYSFVTIDALRGFSSRVRASNGKVAAFGTPWYGSLANRLPVGVRAVGLAADPATGGYWILKSTGAISAFRAPWRGSLASKVPAGSALTALAAGRPGGYLILTANGAVYNFGTPWYGSDANQLPRT